MNTEQKFNWGEFEQKLRKNGGGSFSLGIPPSPCGTCPIAAGKGGCHKPVNPDFSTSCRKWDDWFYEVWPLLREKIRGDRHV